MISTDTKHNLVWNVIDRNGNTQQPYDRSRDWRIAPYDTDRVTDSEACCWDKRTEMFTIKVKYQGSQPINTEVLTRHYERDHLNVPSIVAIICGTLLFFPLFIWCVVERANKNSREEENARLYNEFVAKTLSEADQEVDRRIAAISGAILHDNNPRLAEQKQVQELEAEVANLQIKLLQQERDKLRAQINSAS